jgi:predicted GIY-YIG superfamily endonuclease
MEAMEMMALSRNPKVVKIAKRLTMRVRMTKLRTAARFAGKMAAVQKEELMKKGEWNEDGDKDEFSRA